MKKIAVLSSIAFITVASFALAQSPLTLAVKKTALVNGTADANSLTVPLSTASVGVTGCGNVATIGAALEFQFKNGLIPVNVTGFKMTSATYTLVNSGAATSWTNVPQGAYNPTGDLSVPDMLTYDLAGNKTSVDNTAVVGTSVATVSRFQILDQEIVLGNTARPRFTTAGQYYELTRSLTFTYTYAGVVYNDSITPTQSAVRVQVQQDLAGFIPVGVGPFPINLQVSQDMVNWKAVLVPIPYPRPTAVADIIALCPATVPVPGLISTTTRFYRFVQ